MSREASWWLLTSGREWQDSAGQCSLVTAWENGMEQCQGKFRLGFRKVFFIKIIADYWNSIIVITEGFEITYPFPILCEVRLFLARHYLWLSRLWRADGWRVNIKREQLITTDSSIESRASRHLFLLSVHLLHPLMYLPSVTDPKCSPFSLLTSSFTNISFLPTVFCMSSFLSCANTKNL